ncbi:MAG: carbohydrate kinase family protein [Gammaproteobacteria bacterium]|nr:carbohydrate kinase family protein [Gammaproteobacteria bacterium]
MTALICGSFAYDSIMIFPDRFKRHILPDKIHMLNVSFMVPQMRREFGGCAGNIAYNLKLLGGDGLPMGTVGKDFEPYARWMDRNGISRQLIREFHESFTAQAYITTDLDDNQITAFHPGAMELAHENRVPLDRGITLGIISPDGRDGMLQHAEQFFEAGIPFIFDPGQGLPMFDGDDLRNFLRMATYLTVNDYEAQLVQERTGLSPHEMAEHVKAVFVTRGANGSRIYAGQKEIDIPPVKPAGVVDPTGCGDAYRAGLIHGLMLGRDLSTAARIASLMGTIKIEHPGTQNHSFTPEEFATRYRAAFGTSI